MQNLSRIALAIAFALVGGCVAPTEPLAPASIDEDALGRVPLEVIPLEDLPPGSEVLDEPTETVVWIHEDGTETVEVHAIEPSWEVVPYDDDVTSPLALTHDTGCAGASLWLYDATGNTGRRICFHTPPGALSEARLENYCHSRTLLCSPPLPGQPASCTQPCVASWAGRVRSAWSGDAPGFLYRGGDLACRDHFGVQHRRDTLSCGAIDRAQFGTDARLIDAYRLHKPSDGHAWVTSIAERDAAVGTGWSVGGVGFRCWSAPVLGSFPLYRVWSRSQTQHVLTISDYQRDWLIANEGFESQGILCHVMSDPSGYSADHYGTACALVSTYSAAQTDSFYTLDALEAQFVDACHGYNTPDTSRTLTAYPPVGWSSCSPPVLRADAVRWRDTGACPSGSGAGPRRVETPYNVGPTEWDADRYVEYEGSFYRHGTIDGDLLDIRVQGDWDVWFIPSEAEYDCETMLTTHAGGFTYVPPWGLLSAAALGGMDRIFPTAESRSLRTIGGAEFAACASPRSGDVRELPLVMIHTAP